MALTFVTGPVRSGKSSFAAYLAAQSGLPVSYVATAARYDDDPEWLERLLRHQRERPSAWKTVETARWGNDEIIAFVDAASSDECLLFDAMGTYISSRIDQHLALAADDRVLQAYVENDVSFFVDALIRSHATIVVVGEQVGWDIVPAASAGRLFRDVLGRAQRKLANAADRAYLIVAGFALDLRVVGTPIEEIDPRLL